MATIEVKAKPKDRVWVLDFRMSRDNRSSTWFVAGQRTVREVHIWSRWIWYGYRYNHNDVKRPDFWIHHTKAAAKAEADRRNKEVACDADD